MLYDGGKILTGLGVFLAAALLPFWHNAVAGKKPRPEPKLVTTETRCVQPKDVMRASHMALLDRWRDEVVRQGVRTTTTADGRVLEMSLTNGCLTCHPNKKEFCDACHNYLAVTPYCWQCHVERKEKAS
jgi:hypothetical protein